MTNIVDTRLTTLPIQLDANNNVLANINAQNIDPNTIAVKVPQRSFFMTSATDFSTTSSTAVTVLSWTTKGYAIMMALALQTPEPSATGGVYNGSTLISGLTDILSDGYSPWITSATVFVESQTAGDSLSVQVTGTGSTSSPVKIAGLYVLEVL